MPRSPYMTPLAQAEREKPVPPGYRPRHSQQETTEEYSFDELAKGVASGTISRGLAIKIAGAALLAALFGGSVATEEAEAATDQVCRNKPAISNKRCPGTAVDCSPTNSRCECTKTVNGDKRCVDYTGTVCPSRDECDRNRDCRRGEVCAQVGGCCGSPRRNLCVPLCRD